MVKFKRYGLCEEMNPFFWSPVFDKIEQRKNLNPLEDEIEITIVRNLVYFSWNDDSIQELAENLGEAEFPRPRPCG